MFDMTKIGKRIASLRKKRGMTQMSLANTLGISYQAVSNWERGIAMPDIANLKELAEILDTTADYLLDDSEKAQILTAVDAGEGVDAELTPAEFNDMAPLLTSDKNMKLLDSVALPFNEDEAKDALANLDCDDFSDEDYARMAVESGNAAILSLCIGEVSDELRAELFEIAFDHGNPAIFSQFMDRITEENAEFYAERAYSEGKIPIFSMLKHKLSDEKLTEFARRAFDDHRVAFVSELCDYYPESELKKYKNRAFFSGSAPLFALFKNRCDKKEAPSDDEDFDL